MASLKTELFGIQFPNPFLISSCPATSSGDKVMRAFKAGWGGVVLKTFGLDPTPNVSPRIYAMKVGRTRIGMFDIELYSARPIEWWESQIRLIRDSYPNRPLIASISGRNSAFSWQEVVRRVEPLGINAFEMNLSCPSFDKERGSKLGQDPASLQQAVRWVRTATDLPVIVKLTPNVTDIVMLAQAALEAGANGFTCANSLTGIAGIDLETFEPLPAVGGMSIAGGYGGPGLKPVSLAHTASVAKALHVPMMGVGGISRWQDAVEYMAVGAGLVQVCTAVLLNGYELIRPLTRGLSQYLERRGFQKPADLVGRALPRLGTFSDLDLSIRMLPRVDPALCNGCAICFRACSTGGFEAIRMEDKLAVVDAAVCDGCGLCASLCPEGAMRMVEKN